MPIRLALRMLRRSPWFAVTSIGIVALATALASTVFAVVDGVLFKRLPYKDPDGLVFVFRPLSEPARLAQLRQGTGRSGQPFSHDDLMTWRGAGVLSITTFVSNFGVGPVAGGDVSDETTWAARVDRSFFDVLGMHPLAGGFRDDHYRRPFESGKLSAHPAIISYRLWKRIGGVDAALPGTLLRVGDGTLDVVGVLPPDFVFPTSFARTAPDVLLPLDVTANARSLQGIGRLAPGVSLAEARERLVGIVLEPVNTTLGSRERPVFRMTLAAVIAVLLLGSLNVAVLLSARRRDRSSELAVRIALGASTAQLLQLLVAEATLIALAGACLGVAAAKPMLATVLTLLPTGYLLIKPPSIDTRVLAFALAAATSTLLAFAAWPAFRAARTAYAGLRQEVGATRAGNRWRRAALAAQSAIGIAVVLSGTLLLAGFVTLWREDTGIDRSNTGVVDVTARSIRDPTRRALALEEAVHVASRVPGVLRVSGFSGAFLINAIGGSAFETPSGALEVIAQDVPVSAGFFQIAGIRLLAGRLLTDDEVTSGRPVAVVSDGLARAFWPGRDAIGQVLSGPRGAVSVVGIAKDIRIVGLEERQPTAEIYVPMAIAPPQRDRVLVLRAADNADDVARDVAAAIRRALPDVLITRAASIDSALAGTVRTRQFQAVLFGGFSCAALVLLGVGMFGAVAMNTAARSSEIGVRIALGATAARVQRMVIAENLAPVVAGLFIGGAAAWWTMRLLASLIYGVGAYDPRLWALAASFVLATALIAAWLPARRASRVDPQVVLKAQ